jgi:hypothetical protein
MRDIRLGDGVNNAFEWVILASIAATAAMVPVILALVVLKLLVSLF